MVEKPYIWKGGATLLEHTKRKHKILREYFARYLAVRCQFPQQSKFRVAIVEGFAGGGHYASGDPGSPIIFIEELIAAADTFFSDQSVQLTFGGFIGLSWAVKAVNRHARSEKNGSTKFTTNVPTMKPCSFSNNGVLGAKTTSAAPRRQTVASIAANYGTECQHRRPQHIARQIISRIQPT